MTLPATRGGIATATGFAVAGIAVLVGLGAWQLERKASKESLIAQVSARLDGAPRPLPPREQWPRLDSAAEEFRRIVFAAVFPDREPALVYTPGSPFRPDVSGAGYWVLSPARLPSGGVVVVNRGFLPLGLKDSRKDSRKDTALAPPAGSVQVTGAMRWPETRGLFTPADDPAHGIWYTRAPQAIAAANNWGEVAPFYVELESPKPATGLPRAGRLAVALPNNHLQYALTWFGLAAGLAGVYLAWLSGRRRRG